MKDFDYRVLNIKGGDGKWLCPSCGFPGVFQGASFVSDGPVIGTGICPRCLYEPGYDDISAASGCEEKVPYQALLAYSAKWSKGGMMWQGESSYIPKDWDAKRQYQALAASWPVSAASSSVQRRLSSNASTRSSLN